MLMALEINVSKKKIVSTAEKIVLSLSLRMPAGFVGSMATFAVSRASTYIVIRCSFVQNSSSNYTDDGTLILKVLCCVYVTFCEG